MMGFAVVLQDELHAGGLPLDEQLMPEACAGSQTRGTLVTASRSTFDAFGKKPAQVSRLQYSGQSRQSLDTLLFMGYFAHPSEGGIVTFTMHSGNPEHVLHAAMMSGVEVHSRV